MYAAYTNFENTTQRADQQGRVQNLFTGRALTIIGVIGLLTLLPRAPLYFFFFLLYHLQHFLVLIWLYYMEPIFDTFKTIMFNHKVSGYWVEPLAPVPPPPASVLAGQNVPPQVLAIVTSQFPTHIPPKNVFILFFQCRKYYSSNVTTRVTRPRSKSVTNFHVFEVHAIKSVSIRLVLNCNEYNTEIVKSIMYDVLIVVSLYHRYQVNIVQKYKKLQNLCITSRISFTFSFRPKHNVRRCLKKENSTSSSVSVLIPPLQIIHVNSLLLAHAIYLLSWITVDKNIKKIVYLYR